MKLSVVVPTLNDRETLHSCLDALSSQLPAESELIVVNGPSTDGTSGTVRERQDVDVLVEISERESGVARNAGIEVATGSAVGFVAATHTVEPGWYQAVETALSSDSDVVTGPVKRADSIPTERDPVRFAGRSITVFSAGNVVFDRTVLDRLDGFDENLSHASARDVAHRIGAGEYVVTWSADMAVTRDREKSDEPENWGGRYRSLSYRLAKNYGPRPTVFTNTVGSAIRDGLHGVREIASGETTPTTWIRDGVAVVSNTLAGLWHGFGARYRDRSETRNPNGVSSRHDRAVQVYDRRTRGEE
ncbi:glycosyltransferase family 2 protein [Halovivax gelatinilyticus]|uniref:glycosyltransferase family 2 protein n=1 Tax=Halovivax gelatinilyticus TaxID=2961597 RepID=UPI0020CA9422|nr:glycosyltransferase family A protein [Halovivax gelatinilyticus]